MIKWELLEDQAGYDDDPTIVTALGRIEGEYYMFIGHRKVRNTEEDFEHNFAVPTPHGYKKALGMLKYAEHCGFPIVIFVDTTGSFADLKSEELGQGEAIAHYLRTLFGLKVPIITIVTGEGGPCVALAIACANKLLMLENSAFYVESTDASATILQKFSAAALKAPENLNITAQEHFRLRIAGSGIPEPLGGAHANPQQASSYIKNALLKAMENVVGLALPEELESVRFRYWFQWLKNSVEVEPADFALVDIDGALLLVLVEKRAPSQVEEEERLLAGFLEAEEMLVVVEHDDNPE
ncbi:OLC1v1014253C1 [Oldenlandia corymbosa var. corymbosa]|uniref:acetyl-CoA carboxytransferase n=1 Tax=Oldenlandia corymbosa var. corymbosa TaxID=529605 RepID=A0AAV1E091_OLDCO|nr:OLC1v1014253C1 [Oldenlandia corymbosa var. corymbosa]